MQNGFRVGESHYVEPSLNTVNGPAGIIRLEPKIMQVLVCLAAHAGQVVPKERLMRTVWPDTFVGDDVLTRSISELRRVFGDDVKEPRFIQTIPKGGYRLIAGVSSNAVQDLAAPTQAPNEIARGSGDLPMTTPPSRKRRRGGSVWWLFVFVGLLDLGLGGFRHADVSKSASSSPCEPCH